ncbi:N-acetyl-gamma-glutamyl-phosphate reductase [bacterium]|nr:N-acetyl-gamma-glutamyl-phosphate reductase [bacterium]
MSQKTSPDHVKVAVVGASGYSGEELVKLLLLHPNVELTVLTSRQYAGRSLNEVFPRFSNLPGASTLHFTAPDCQTILDKAELAFLALPHGVAAEFAVPLCEGGCQVIDLSADFRIHDPVVYEEFYGAPHPAPQLLEKAVYGLPERHRDQIKEAQLIASPGCYPTSILLPCLPLISEGLIQPSTIIANSLSGASGAGRKADIPFLYVECNESVRPYGVPKHRHLSEIEQEISIAAGEKVVIQFTPHLIPVNRGILTTLTMAPSNEAFSKDQPESFVQKVTETYDKAYKDEAFVRLLGISGLPDTKHVVGTNNIEFAWRLDTRTGRLIIMSAEDNLVKGASGQAIQSMNILRDFPETNGLLL